jgi:hypothetical protein
MKVLTRTNRSYLQWSELGPGGGQAHVPSCAFFIGEKQELSDHLIRSFFPIVIDQKSDPKYSCNNNREVNRV